MSRAPCTTRAGTPIGASPGLIDASWAFQSGAAKPVEPGRRPLASTARLVQLDGDVEQARVLDEVRLGAIAGSSTSSTDSAGFAATCPYAPEHEVPLAAGRNAARGQQQIHLAEGRRRDRRRRTSRSGAHGGRELRGPQRGVAALRRAVDEHLVARAGIGQLAGRDDRVEHAAPLALADEERMRPRRAQALVVGRDDHRARVDERDELCGHGSTGVVGALLRGERARRRAASPDPTVSCAQATTERSSSTPPSSGGAITNPETAMAWPSTAVDR